MKKLLFLLGLLFCENLFAADTFPLIGTVPVLQGPVIQTVYYKYTVIKKIGKTDNNGIIYQMTDGNSVFDAIMYNIGLGIYRYCWTENTTRKYLTVNTISGRACLE